MGKKIHTAEDFQDTFDSMVNNELLGGVYLARPTGEVLEEDHTYIEVIHANKSFFAKPCMSFGGWNIPSRKWLEKYKDTVMVWIAFENGNSAHATYLGISPLDDKKPDLPYLNGHHYKSTEFVYYFDDDTKTYKIYKKDAEEKFLHGVEITENTIKVSDSKGNTILLDSKNSDITLQNSKKSGVKTAGDSTILGKGNGAQKAVKGTQHIQNIQNILNRMLSDTLIVSGSTATFNPATIAQLQTEISKLDSDLSDTVKLD